MIRWAISGKIPAQGLGTEPGDGLGGEAEPAKRILVVEDEWLVAHESESALEDAGYVVVGVAASADEAVTMADIHRPDLVLMDIRLQGDGDGIDAAIEINRRLRIRSVFVTANVDAPTRERAQAAEPVAWIAKPYSTQQLLNDVADALDEITV